MDLTERNANHIITSCCYLPVSGRSLSDWAWEQQAIGSFYFIFIVLLLEVFPRCRGFSPANKIITFSFHRWRFSIDLHLELCPLCCQDPSCSVSKTLVSSSSSSPPQFAFINNFGNKSIIHSTQTFKPLEFFKIAFVIVSSTFIIISIHVSTSFDNFDLLVNLLQKSILIVFSIFNLFFLWDI